MSSGSVDTHGAALRSARRAVAVIFFVNGALVATWAARIPAVQRALALSAGALGLALLALRLVPSSP